MKPTVNSVGLASRNHRKQKSKTWVDTMTSSEMKLSGPEKRALKLFSRIDGNLFERNRTDKDTQQTVRKLALSKDGMGTSVLKSDGLFFDNPKANPKNYKEIRPDWIWQNDFIEVKDKIMGESWEKLSIHSLNDQLRILLLRLAIVGISGLVRYQFADLMPTEQRLVEQDLARFKNSRPNDRCYIRWDEIVSVIPSPNDNFEICNIQICDFELPVRIVADLEKMRSPRLYLLDNQMMDVWEKVLF